MRSLGSRLSAGHARCRDGFPKVGWLKKQPACHTAYIIHPWLWARNPNHSTDCAVVTGLLEGLFGLAAFTLTTLDGQRLRFAIALHWAADVAIIGAFAMWLALGFGIG
jgi:hypothetical protein